MSAGVPLGQWRLRERRTQSLPRRRFDCSSIKVRLATLFLRIASLVIYLLRSCFTLLLAALQLIGIKLGVLKLGTSAC